jgi:hypothetical protein
VSRWMYLCFQDYQKFLYHIPNETIVKYFYIYFDIQICRESPEFLINVQSIPLLLQDSIFTLM